MYIWFEIQVYIVTHRRVLIEICIRLSDGLNMRTLLMFLETLECINYMHDTILPTVHIKN